MRIWSIVFLSALAALPVGAASKLQLQIGQPAPDFKAMSTGGEVQLSDFKGKWLVLYFYPKSFSGACTKQACALRDNVPRLDKLDAEVLGASRDDMETQKKFKAEHKLPFELIADIEKTVAKSYDVIGFAGLYQRRTVIIDPDGKVAHVFYVIDVNKHGEEVSDRLRKLQGKD